MRKPSQKMPKPSRAATLLLSTLLLTVLLTGCQTTRVVAISGDKSVVRMPAGTAYTPEINGWFVPDARMLEILDSADANFIKKKR